MTEIRKWWPSRLWKLVHVYVVAAVAVLATIMAVLGERAENRDSAPHSASGGDTGTRGLNDQP